MAIGRPRRSSRLIALGALAGTAALFWSGADRGVDRLLEPIRFAVAHRTASGRVAVVEMDAASAAAIKRWPWSRTHYAAVIDRLHRAGAASIVFDVDLSSASDEAGDHALERALARAGGAIALPTFGQAAGSGDRRTIDALPLPRFQRHAASASVSISPDTDGQIRSMPFATATQGVPRPSLSSFIAGRSGTVGVEFPIDLSIDPATIPRLSFVAVRDGRFDPAAVRGRDVLIGATAVEMGDRYSTPVWGVLPGVVIQALATETLLRGSPSRSSSAIPLILAAIVAGVALRRRSGKGVAAAALGGGGALVAGVLAAQHLLLVTFPLAGALALIGATGAGAALRQALRSVRHQRTIDEETGLPNARALLHAAVATPRLLAVADFADFDGILAVLGPAATATLVNRVAERLALTSDGPVHRIADRQLAFRAMPAALDDDALEALRVMMLQPVEVGGRRIDVTLTIGVAAGDDAQALADAALAAAEAARSGRFWRRASADHADVERAMSLMGELDEALENGAITVFYQPKLDLRGNRVASVEALVRWRHATRGFIGPDLFIPLVESSGRIAPMTLYVLAEVIRDLGGWQTAARRVTAAVNISATLLADGGFNAAVERLIADSGVAPSLLVFEVTESAAMSDPDAAIAALDRYRALGIAVSMDDYGTGLSTLTYLRRLPLTELKIDKSFVEHAHVNEADAVLVRSTIDLAHELGIKVVAEGVETSEGLAFLRHAGCDMAQGYVISRPVPNEQLLALLDDRPAALSA